ncbi:MAG: D-2-hydroxyacid dehydrogenase [Acidobacteria bacterium]|nr:D-2-hydroxyacid dehydrogenase [Acidobacteriota bacterium]
MKTRFLVFWMCGAALWGAEAKKILVTGLAPAEVEDLKRTAPAGVEIVAAAGPALRAQAADADAILGAMNNDLLSVAKKLAWVQSYSAGVERWLTPEFKASGVTLTNGKIIQGPNIADHAFSMLLALTRELHRIIPNRVKEEWMRGKFEPIELRGKTAVIVGVGGIGMQIAQRAKGFDMRVIGVDPKDISYTPLVDRMVTPDRLDSVLPEADVVFLSAPHTPQSEGMMGARQFELLKKGAYFVAVSRGKLYDTDALVKALDSRRVAGAGLDVTNPEPLPKGHALWKFENVIVTPHIAGQSDHVQQRRMDLLKENIRRFAAGEPLLNVVDKAKGY